MRVTGIHAFDAWRQRSPDDHKRFLDRLHRISWRRIDIAETNRAVFGRKSHDRAFLRRLGRIGVLEPSADERYSDAEHVDALDGQIKFVHMIRMRL
jgi:hypothetical protein